MYVKSLLKSKMMPYTFIDTSLHENAIFDLINFETGTPLYYTIYLSDTTLVSQQFFFFWLRFFFFRFAF